MEYSWGTQWASPYMRRALLASIRGYQKYLSPYKGFCCAYGQHTGRASCSAFGYRAVRRHGVFGGLVLIRQRSYLCGVAHRRHCQVGGRPDHSQRGFCDVGCDAPCDASCGLPGGEGLVDACDLASCGDCGGCDWPQRRSKSAEKEKYVYIPPRVWSRVEPSSHKGTRSDA